MSDAGTPAPPAKPVVVGERALLIAHAALLLAVTAVAALTSRAADWSRLDLFAVLFIFGLGSELLALDVRGIRLTAASTARVLAAATLGPAPAVAIACATSVIDSVVRRRPALPHVANVAGAATAALTAGLWLRLATSGGTPAPEELGFAALVTAACLWDAALTSLLVAAGTGLYEGVRIVRKLSEQAAPAALLELSVALLTGVTVYVYERVGLPALTLLAVVLIIFQFMLRELTISLARAEEIAELAASRGRLVAQALDAEDRERKRLAEALHDGAIQNLIAAQFELERAEHGDAESVARVRAAVGETVGQLRSEVFDLHPTVLEHAGLRAAIRAVADQQQRLAGFSTVVEITDDALGLGDQLVFSLARELMVNARKHSEASELSVRVFTDGERVVLEVSDDGRGFDAQQWQRARVEGHIGLASAAERVEAIGGRFALSGGPGNGTRVRIELPRLGETSAAGQA